MSERIYNFQENVYKIHQNIFLQIIIGIFI